MEIGLFPLGLVLLPGERAPLHIFEPRYKELTGEVIDSRGEFGIVLSDASGMRSVGTTATVVDVLGRFPDGRLDIVVEGQARFRIVRLTEGRSFMTAEVEPVEDDGELPTEDDIRRCIEAYANVADAAGVEPSEIEPDPARLAFDVAGRIDFGAEVKQELLELRSARARLTRLADLLDGAVEVTRLQRLARRRAVGDGRVEHT